MPQIIMIRFGARIYILNILLRFHDIFFPSSTKSLQRQHIRAKQRSIPFNKALPLQNVILSHLGRSASLQLLQNASSHTAQGPGLASLPLFC